MRSLRSRCCAVVLAFGVLLLASLRPAAARGRGPDVPPAAGERVVKIGPQAVVIVNERGDVRMYDDPTEQAPACKSRGGCWGKSLGLFGFFFAAIYEDVTTNVEGSGQGVQRLPAEE